MRPAVLSAIMLLAAPSGVSAFLFGKISDKEAAEMLGRMADAFDRGDCSSVAALSEDLFNEKPPSDIREKAYYYLGRCYEVQGATDKAVTIYNLAYGLYPDNKFFSSRLSAIYLHAGFYAEAIPLFKRMLQDRADDIAANAGLGRCYASLGFLSKAKLYYSRAVVLGEFKDMGLLKEYASWMLKKRDWEEAELILNYAVRLDSGDAQLRESLSRAAAGRGDYGEAAGRLREAVNLAPADRSLALALALAELLDGNYEAALAAVPSAKGEKNALALVVRGMALHKKGDRDGAVGCFRKASISGGRSFVAAFAAALAAGGTEPEGAYARKIP